MARFKLEIFKRIGSERWENRYWLETLSFTTATEVAEDVIIAEANFHSTQVAFEYARISTQVEGDDLFVNLPLSISGNVAASTTGGLLPLWNVVKVYLGKDLQRPDYKLYRGCIGETNSEAGSIAAGTRNDIKAQLDVIALGDPALIWPASGLAYASVTVDPLIRQRQLHRRKRRVASEGLAGV